MCDCDDPRQETDETERAHAYSHEIDAWVAAAAPAPRQMPAPYSRAEVERIFDAAPDPRARLMLALMLDCGLRCSEIASARVHDVNFHKRRLKVRDRVGNYRRQVYLSPRLMTHLHSYLAEKGISEGALIRPVR